MMLAHPATRRGRKRWQPVHALGPGHEHHPQPQQGESKHLLRRNLLRYITVACIEFIRVT